MVWGAGFVGRFLSSYKHTDPDQMSSMSENAHHVVFMADYNGGAGGWLR